MDYIYIVAWLNVPEWSPNHSAGDVDWMWGLADDYLSSDDKSAQKEGETSVSLMGTGLAVVKVCPIQCPSTFDQPKSIPSF